MTTDQIAALLGATFTRRASLMPAMTDAFRCIQRGEIPAIDCAIDYYAGYLCVWGYEGGVPMDALHKRLQPYLSGLQQHYGARGGVIKQSVPDPHRKGLVAEQRMFGDAPPAYFPVTEHGLQFSVSLTARQHVGLFLDQRDNRQLIRRVSHGKNVANLFSYTCSFSVAAAAGGCRSVTSIDVSRPSLQIGRENFLLNSLDNVPATFCQQDVRRWLAAQMKKGNRYEVIICDPPTYATTKEGGAFSLADAWEPLVRDCRAILTDGGGALFSNNHQAGSRDQYRRTLTNHFRSVDDVSPPPDFPILPNRHDHVRMFWCRG